VGPPQILEMAGAGALRRRPLGVNFGATAGWNGLGRLFVGRRKSSRWRAQARFASARFVSTFGGRRRGTDAVMKFPLFES